VGAASSDLSSRIGSPRPSRLTSSSADWNHLGPAFGRRCRSLQGSHCTPPRSSYSHRGSRSHSHRPRKRRVFDHDTSGHSTSEVRGDYGQWKRLGVGAMPAMRRPPCLLPFSQPLLRSLRLQLLCGRSLQQLPVRPEPGDCYTMPTQLHFKFLLVN